MVNGHSVLTLVVLRESPEIPEGFGFKTVEQYRELALEADGFVCRVWRRSGPKGGGPLAVTEAFKPEGVTGRLKEIPFTFVGAQNNDPSIDESPLYDIAMINLGHYRNSADYEDSVFWCGQAQPWISGLDEQWRDWMEKNGVYVGSRAPMMLPAGGQFGYAQPLPNTLVKEAMADKNQMMIEHQLDARMDVQLRIIGFRQALVGPSTALSAIMPVLKLGIITVPDLPSDLVAQSSAQLVP